MFEVRLPARGHAAAGAVALVLFASCGGGGGSSSAQFKVHAPETVFAGSPIKLPIQVPADLSVSAVKLEVNGTAVATSVGPPFATTFTPSAPPGTTLSITAVALDAVGAVIATSTTSSKIGLGGAPEIAVQDVTEVDPGIFRIDVVLKGATGATFAQPTLAFTTDDEETILPGTRVGKAPPAVLDASPLGIPWSFEWSAAADLGLADAPKVRVGVACVNSQGIWRSGASSSFAVKNATAVADFRDRLFPNLADILDHSSPRYAGVVASATTVEAAPGILRTDFVFESTHFLGSGLPSNGCPGCESWKKDVWTNLHASVYVAAGATPSRFVLVDPLLGPDTLWSPKFATLFPEFDDGSIAGAGDPAQADAGSFTESIAKTIQELGVGVLTGIWEQGGLSAGGFKNALLLSLDEAITTGEPRWNLFAGMAEAQMRGMTAVEILRGAEPGSLSFAIHGGSRNGWAAAIASAADERIRGAALYDGADSGRWSLMGQVAEQFETPLLQTPWDQTVLAIQALGFPLAHVLDGAGFAALTIDPAGIAFAKYADPARQIALGVLQGKPYLLQSATADHFLEPHVRQLWFDDDIRVRYPGPWVRQCNGANADHTSAGPQGALNLRSFVATALDGRPRSDVHLTLEPGPGALATFRAKVSNPDPAKVAVASVRLRFAHDDDGDFRVIGLPVPQCPSCCFKPGASKPVVCLDLTASFLNRTWDHVDMTASSIAGEWTATIDPSAIGPLEDPHVAVFAEVEDVALAGPVASRSFASSEIVFLEK